MVTLSRLLHAGYLFESAGVQIAFDPIFETPFSVNCHPFPRVSFDLEAVRRLELSAIFISHIHDDHCSLESLVHLDRATPIYIFAVSDDVPDLLRELGFARVQVLKLGEPISVGPFRVTPLEALDADVDSIFHIEVYGLNILNVVDSWIGDKTMALLERTAAWDLVLWPFQTMRELEVLSPSRASPPSRELPPEWIEQLQRLQPRAIVPSSCQFQLEPWSWYNSFFFPISYRQFASEMADRLSHAKVIRLDPGVSIKLDDGQIQFGERISWIHPIGNQDVDYEFRQTAIPPTREIAKRFPALTPEETSRIHEFCRAEIPRRPVETDLRTSSLWRLSVYDHLGEAAHFHYRHLGSRFELCGPSDGAIGWTTDVPAYKLFGALERGESLTSMYVRVNDETLSAEAEAGLKDFDVLMDPLVQCLFAGSSAAYQKAQLRRWLAPKQ